MAILASLFALQFAWAQPGNYDVEAGAFYFSPQTNEVNEDGILEIEVGSTVTWINVGGFHDVNFETNSITGESFGNPESFSFLPNSLVIDSEINNIFFGNCFFLMLFSALFLAK